MYNILKNSSYLNSVKSRWRDYNEGNQQNIQNHEKHWYYAFNTKTEFLVVF